MRLLALLTTTIAATFHTSLALVDVCNRTTVELVAPECDGRTPGVVCGADGCFRDRYGYVWYCFSQIDDDPINQRCWITFSFGEPQDLHSVYITLFGGTENTKTLTFFLDGGVHGEIETSDGPIEYLLDAENVSEVKIYADHDASIIGMASVIDEAKFLVE